MSKRLGVTASENLLSPPAQCYASHSLFYKSFILEPRVLKIMQIIECISSEIRNCEINLYYFFYVVKDLSSPNYKSSFLSFYSGVCFRTFMLNLSTVIHSQHRTFWGRPLMVLFWSRRPGPY